MPDDALHAVLPKRDVGVQQQRHGQVRHLQVGEDLPRRRPKRRAMRLCQGCVSEAARVGDRNLVRAHKVGAGAARGCSPTQTGWPKHGPDRAGSRHTRMQRVASSSQPTPWRPPAGIIAVATTPGTQAYTYDPTRTRPTLRVTHASCPPDNQRNSHASFPRCAVRGAQPARLAKLNEHPPQFGSAQLRPWSPRPCVLENWPLQRLPSASGAAPSATTSNSTALQPAPARDWRPVESPGSSGRPRCCQ